MTKEMMDVLLYIPIGKQNAVPRTELCASVGYSDRFTRQIISQLREEGYLIMNDQDGCGYYISDDLDAIEKQYRQDTSRAMKILKRRKHARRILKANGRKV